MKKFFIFLSFLLSLVLFISIGEKVNVVNATTYAPDESGNWYWGYESSFDFDDYYESADGITDATLLKNALHTILTTNIKKLSYSGAYTALNTADSSPNDSSKIICMYTGRLFATSAHGSSGTETWNREHTWAKSHGFQSNESFYAYTDINHLRATECQINSSRNNSDFGEVDGTPDEYGNTWTSSIFEPRDAVKGDVARIMMYMTVRYIGDSVMDNGVSLTLVNGTTSASSLKGQFGDLETLKKWHEEDPVDDLERRRNDLVYEIQGNRNPFIDHPEYANILFGTNYNDETSKTFTVKYSVDDETSFNYTDSTKYESGMLINEPSIIPSKAKMLFDGWYSDAALTNKWDFATSKITANLTLYPKFVAKELTPIEKFQELTGKASLSFTYQSEGSSSLVTNSIAVKASSGSGPLNGKANLTTSLNSYFDSSITALFDINVNYNGKGNFYIKPDDIRLYNYGGNGTAIEFIPHDGVSIDKIELINPSGTDYEITISKDKAIVQNIASATSQYIKIAGFNITYTTGTDTTQYTCDYVNMRFLYVIPKDLTLELNEIDEDFAVGFKFNDTYYAATKVLNDDGSISFGLLITAIPTQDFNADVVVSAYIGYNGQRAETDTVSKTVKNILNTYLTDYLDNEAVITHLGVLKYLYSLA